MNVYSIDCYFNDSRVTFPVDTAYTELGCYQDRRDNRILPSGQVESPMSAAVSAMAPMAAVLT